MIIMITLKVKQSYNTSMEEQGERRYSSYSFTTPALDGVSGQRHAPAALYPRRKDPGTHWTGGWVGLRSGLDTDIRGKILCLCWGSNLDSPVTILTELHWLLRISFTVINYCHDLLYIVLVFISSSSTLFNVIYVFF
jgi:hypothetical protein